jgi:hypothetical protein
MLKLSNGIVSGGSGEPCFSFVMAVMSRTDVEFYRVIGYYEVRFSQVKLKEKIPNWHERNE